MTLESLKAYGANTEEGLARCLNNESFYLKMVNLALADKNFDGLKRTMDAGDARAAFETAHALKGCIGNVALTGLGVTFPVIVIIAAFTALLGKDRAESYFAMRKVEVKRDEHVFIERPYRGRA